jgi:hypothetical protein
VTLPERLRPAEPDVEVRRPPSQLNQLLVPSSILKLTLSGLRSYVPVEGLCYWYGRQLDKQLGVVMVAAFPRIYSTDVSFELMPGQMSQLTTWSAREELWLLAQVHTHPTDEPHSHADEEWSPTHREGFISVVIPFRAQFSDNRRPHFRVFECNSEGKWSDAPNDRVHIFDDVWLPAK